MISDAPSMAQCMELLLKDSCYFVDFVNIASLYLKMHIKAADERNQAIINAVILLGVSKMASIMGPESRIEFRLLKKYLLQKHPIYAPAAESAYTFNYVAILPEIVQRRSS